MFDELLSTLDRVSDNAPAIITSIRNTAQANTPDTQPPAQSVPSPVVPVVTPALSQGQMIAIGAGLALLVGVYFITRK